MHNATTQVLIIFWQLKKITLQPAAGRMTQFSSSVFPPMTRAVMPTHINALCVNC